MWLNRLYRRESPLRLSKVLSDVAPEGYSRRLVDADGQRKLWVGFAFGVKTVLCEQAATMMPRSPDPADPAARWDFNRQYCARVRLQ